MNIYRSILCSLLNLYCYGFESTSKLMALYIHCQNYDYLELDMLPLEIISFFCDYYG